MQGTKQEYSSRSACSVAKYTAHLGGAALFTFGTTESYLNIICKREKTICHVQYDPVAEKVLKVWGFF